VWVGSGGPKRFLMSASLECTAAELPTRGMLAHLQLSQYWSLGLCVGNSAHSPNLTYLFSIFLSTHCTNFDPKCSIRNIENISYPMVRSCQEMVWWLQSSALRGLFRHVCLRRGRPSSGDDLLYMCPM